MAESKLNYLHSVLGVSYFPRPNASQNKVVCFSNEVLDSSEVALLHKMFASIQLNPEQFEIKVGSKNDLEELISENERFVFLLCEKDLEISERVYSNSKVICSYRPSLLIKDPSLKKVSWQHLKNFSKLLT